MADEKEKPPEPFVLDDPKIDEVVNEIVDAESQQLLGDLDNGKRTNESTKKPKSRLRAWLATKKAKKIILAGAICIILALILLPWTRYFMLNTAGVRVSSSITVLDDSTQQPLKNVLVSFGELSAKTDTEGRITINNLRLGRTTLKIEKIAFAPVVKAIDLGWGTNRLGDFRLLPTGAQYEINVNDFLSGKGITGVEATLEESSALSDESGKIKLTIPKTEADKLTINISAKDYRQETLEIDVNDKSTKLLKLVPAKKHAFVSKRTGKYDIYSIYIDGKDEKLVLKGSGSEREDLTLMPHPLSSMVAYVSTRGNQHNGDGYLLSSLVLINLNDDKTTFVATSERIQLVGWYGNRLVYVQTSAGDSAAYDRTKIMSYNLDDGSLKQLAASNYFNDLVLASGKIYFAPSSTSTSGLSAKFYKLEVDGSGLQTIHGSEVWAFTRTAYDHLALSIGQDWYDYKTGQSTATRLSNAPVNKNNRLYFDSPDGKKSAWVDQRDGKGTLLAYDLAANEDKILTAQKGLGLPLVWLSNNTLVYRLDNNNGVADYAVSLDGGEPIKIKDVTKTNSDDNWYYY